MPRRPRKSSPRSSNRRPQTKAKQPTITGIMRGHTRGFGFVVPDDREQCPTDVFIPPPFMKGAVDGDHVEVAINPEAASEKGPDGRVVSILERGRNQLVGTIEEIDHDIHAYVPLLGEEKVVHIQKKKKQGVSVGDRVTLEVIDWGNKRDPVLCSILEVIGNIEDPSKDIEVAELEFGLSREFPSGVVEQAKTYGAEVKKSDMEGRLDLTDRDAFTIDPETAKDFDDALSIREDEKGHFFLDVHIADAAHYVPVGTPLDEEAMKRCNSTYFPKVCLPMLPFELSNNLCSLKQDVIRLTVSVQLEFDPSGNLLNHRVDRAFIKSRKRFTYGEASEVLEGKRDSDFVEDLKLMVELCKLLKQKRTERGSIDFALPELILLIDDEGQPYGTKIEEYDITHQLVEEFMLKANEVVATHLRDQGKPVLFRVHEEPDTANLDEFYATARVLGFSLPQNPDAKDLQKLFDAAKKTRYSQQLAVHFIRSLKLAIYSPQNVGHFGLALENYCHFTSPIRRYSDLVTQRLLFGQEGKDLDLGKVGEACSEKERNSFRAETSVKLLKKYRLLNAWVEEDSQRGFKATVTKLKPFGLFFDLNDLFLEGFIHISELGNDYFNLDASGQGMVGEKTQKTFKVGDKIQVRPAAIDLITLNAEWSIIK